jgi:CRISPR-associated exonuclease Cas4
VSRPHVSFSDLRTAAYCPRKCYYQRRRDSGEREPPPELGSIRALATRYEELLEADRDLAVEPIAISAGTYHARLAATQERLTEDGHWNSTPRSCRPERSCDRPPLPRNRPQGA